MRTIGRSRRAAVAVAVAVSFVAAACMQAAGAPPALQIVEPGAGAVVTGRVSVRAEARPDRTYVRVEFRASGRVLGTDTTAPYETTWDTTAFAAGRWDLRALAWDATGHVTRSARVSVTVANTGTTTPTTTTPTTIATTTTHPTTPTTSATSSSTSSSTTTTIAGPEPPAGTVFYVDPQTGNDTNPGTSPAAPWRTPPGTRTVNDSGFLRSAWGAVGATSNVPCGATILLKGGATHTSAAGGAWRIDNTYYPSSCPDASPVTITVATPGEWSGSSGTFTIDGRGISTTSPQFAPTGTGCLAGGFCAIVDVERVAGVTIGGRSAGQQLVIRNVTVNAAGYDGGFQLFAAQRVEARWLTIRDRDTFTTFDQAGAINVGASDVYVFHDVLVDNWLEGPGVQVGLMAGSINRSGGFVNVTVRNSGITNPNFPNVAGDAFQLGGTAVADGMGGRGGVWCINCFSIDHHMNGTNSGGSTSSTVDQAVRFRNFRALGNGRTPSGVSKRAGFESVGDDNCTGQETSVFVTNSVFYKNYNTGVDGPHGGGVGVYLNNTFYKGGLFGAQHAYGISACQEVAFNNLMAGGSMPWSSVFGSKWEAVKPVTDHNLYDFAGSENENFSFIRFSPAFVNGAWTTFAQAAAGVAGFTGPNDRISTNARRYLPQFVATGGRCNTGWSDGTAGADFADCDLRLQSTSPAVDAGRPWFRAAAAGSGSTITVVPNGMISNLASDPRMYFVEPDSFYRADLVVGGLAGRGDRVRIAGCGDVEITDMTATTITIAGSCAWTAGAAVHLPYTGTAPDIGAYELGSPNR